ncbi:MAG: NADAR family protein [Patescibacteria group bacterium]
MTNGTSILFSGPHQPFFEFSNLYPQPFWLHGQQWPSSEHLYQTLRLMLVNRQFITWIHDAPSPERVRIVGAILGYPLGEEWLRIRDDYLRLVVLCKFVGHESLQQLLLSTGERHLIEIRPPLGIFSKDEDTGHQNRLGRILMETRDQLRRPGAAHAKLMVLIGQFRQHLQRLQ